MTADRPIRVMRIIARLNVGGPAIHVVLLTARLGPPEFESILVCGQVGPQEGDMGYLAAQHGIEPVSIPELGRELSPLRDVVTLVKLWRLMRRLRPDIVDTHTAKAGFVGRWAAWLARVPVRVHTFHGHVFHGYFSPAKTRVFLWLERLTARLSTRLITISPGLRDELANTYRIAPAHKIEVMPLILDLGAFAETPRHNGHFRRRFDIPPQAPLVGIVGRLVPIKNHELFLQMAARLMQVPALREVRFAIVGDGECRAAVEARAGELGLAGHVLFTGWIADLRDVYSDMDALVISSHNEGTPVSLIEALAAGVPVVSTAVGGVPDLLRGGAYGALVPPGDPDQLADAVREALEAGPAAHEDVRRAILADYDISRRAAELAALYRALLSGAQKGRS